MVVIVNRQREEVSLRKLCLKTFHKLRLDSYWKRRHWRRSGVFIVKFEHISHLAQVFLFLTLNM